MLLRVDCASQFLSLTLRVVAPTGRLPSLRQHEGIPSCTTTTCYRQIAARISTFSLVEAELLCREKVTNRSYKKTICALGNTMTDRRQFMKVLIAAGAATMAGPRAVIEVAGASHPTSKQVNTDPWRQVPGILARIKPPVFPNRDFLLTTYGAKADSTSDCTDAFRKAIAACNESGGGRVVVPSGTFLTGAIHLKNNVNLHLLPGSTIKFYTESEKYLPPVFTRFEGTECLNFSPFIYAYKQQNIAITGGGVLDGSASNANWWAWARRGSDDADSPAKPDIKRLLDSANAVCQWSSASLVRVIFFVRTSFNPMAAAMC